MPAKRKASPAQHEGFTINNIALIYAHPHSRRSSANRRLLEAAATVPSVTIRDLYEHYPDFNIDAQAEQRAIQAADLLVLQYPTHWYSLPPLLKLWIDTVLEYGWAYGPEGTALTGKHLWCVTTTGGLRDSYSVEGIHGHVYEDFLLPLMQTARLCGMSWLPPWILHGVPHLDTDALLTWSTHYRDRLAHYPTWIANPN